MLGMMSPFANAGSPPAPAATPYQAPEVPASGPAEPTSASGPAAAAAPSHKQTMLGMSPVALGLGPPRPAETAPSDPAHAAAPGRLLTNHEEAAPRAHGAAPPAAAKPGFTNRTMLGVAPVAMQPPAAQAAPADPSPQPAAAARGPDLSPQSKRTMLGAVAPVSLSNPPAANVPQPSPEAAQVGSTQRASSALAEQPRQRSFTPVSQVAHALEDEASALAPAKSSGKGPLYAVIGLVVAALLGGAGFYLTTRGPTLTASVAHTPTGDELVVDAPGSAPGAKVRFAGVERPLSAGRASFPLSADALTLGENTLAVDLIEPGGDVDSSQIKLAVDYRVRTDLNALRADPPAVNIVIDALPGSKVSIDGEPLALDARGHGVKSYPVPAQVGARFEIQPRYRIELPSGAPVEGSASLSLPVVSMQIDRPGAEVTTDQSLIELAGVVEAGAEVFVEGRPIEVREGRFLHRAELPQPGDYVLHVVARATGKAPRVQELRLRRVTDLTLAAASFKADSGITYAKLMQNPSTYRGQNVAFDGRVYNVEVNAGRSLIQILVLNCPSSTRCPLWVEYPQATEATVDSWVRVLGTVSGEQQFKSKQGAVQSVPSVQAQYVLKLAR